MPRYHFIVRGLNREYGDDEGADLPDEHFARRLADRLVSQLRNNNDYTEPGMVVVVTDDAGTELYVVPFGQLH